MSKDFRVTRHSGCGLSAVVTSDKRLRNLAVDVTHTDEKLLSEVHDSICTIINAFLSEVTGEYSDGKFPLRDVPASETVLSGTFNFVFYA